MRFVEGRFLRGENYAVFGDLFWGRTQNEQRQKPIQGFFASFRMTTKSKNCNCKYNDGSRSLRMTNKGTGNRKGRGNGKGEIQGTLRCATDGDAVPCFGRDDVFSWWEEERTTAKAKSRSRRDDKEQTTITIMTTATVAANAGS
jgi:hypothetical protein